MFMDGKIPLQNADFRYKLNALLIKIPSYKMCHKLHYIKNENVCARKYHKQSKEIIK